MHLRIKNLGCAKLVFSSQSCWVLFVKIIFEFKAQSRIFCTLSPHPHSPPSRTNIVMSAGRGTKRQAAAMKKAEEEGLTQHTIPPYTPPHAAPHSTPPTFHAYLPPRFLQQNSKDRLRANHRPKEKVHRFRSSTPTSNPVPSPTAPTPFLPPSLPYPLPLHAHICCIYYLSVLQDISETNAGTNAIYWSIRSSH